MQQVAAWIILILECCDLLRKLYVALEEDKPQDVLVTIVAGSVTAFLYYSIGLFDML